MTVLTSRAELTQYNHNLEPIHSTVLSDTLSIYDIDAIFNISWGTYVNFITIAICGSIYASYLYFSSKSYQSPHTLDLAPKIVLEVTEISKYIPSIY